MCFRVWARTWAPGAGREVPSVESGARAPVRVSKRVGSAVWDRLGVSPHVDVSPHMGVSPHVGPARVSPPHV